LSGIPGYRPVAYDYDARRRNSGESCQQFLNVVFRLNATYRQEVTVRLEPSFPRSRVCNLGSSRLDIAPVGDKTRVATVSLLDVLPDAEVICDDNITEPNGELLR
jgi:hypothetical protein